MQVFLQDGLAVLKSMVIFPIGQGVALAFKKEFQEYGLESNLCGSFTRKMIPDISILKTDSDSLERIIVLDAKYRVANQLNDAITSLHMYRDAILQEVKNNPLRKAVIAAYILTPYPSTVASHWKAENMPARLFHHEYRSTFKFGALTLIPGMSLDKVETALDLMLQDTGIESVSHDR